MPVSRPFSRLTVGLLLPALLWVAPAQAFFCMSFGGGAKGRGPAPLPPIMPPPPVSAPVTGQWTAAPVPETPVSDTRRPEPELVDWPVRRDGQLTETQFRFRPLDERRASPVSPRAR